MIGRASRPVASLINVPHHPPAPEERRRLQQARSDQQNRHEADEAYVQHYVNRPAEHLEP